MTYLHPVRLTVWVLLFVVTGIGSALAEDQAAAETPRVIWQLELDAEGSNTIASGDGASSDVETARIEIDDRVAFRGQYSIRHENDGPSRHSLREHINLDYDFKAGQPYTLSAWIRTEEIVDGPIRMQVRHGNQRDRTRSYRDASDWFQAVVTFTPEEDLDSLHMRLGSNTIRTRYWIDEIYLVEGDEPMPAKEGEPRDDRQLLSEPAGLFPTWQRDPATTMTIDWHTEANEQGTTPESVMRYKRVGTDEWHEVEGEQHEFPYYQGRVDFPYSDRMIHRVELTGLEPATAYRFRVGPFKRAYKFRTMPAEYDEPLTFAVGGDTRRTQEMMEEVNRVVMAYDPQFIVWGGDLAYADGREDRMYRWFEWFASIMTTLIHEDGRVVPIIVGIGNHEMHRPVVGDWWWRADNYEQTDEWRATNAPYFFRLFAFPGQPGYNVLDFGDYLSLLMTDTAHANPIEGEQRDWLERTLQAREHVTHLIPVYHAPAYPSVRSYDNRATSEIREYWSPLFERYGVRVAFENHDHAYKRTPSIRAEKVDSDGVVYIGDGAWGVNARDVHDADETWYLERAESIRHAIVVTLDGHDQRFVMVSADGEVFDEYEQTVSSSTRP